jgi:hypothetical protein
MIPKSDRYPASVLQILGECTVTALNSASAKEYERTGEIEPHTMTREALVRLASAIKAALPQYDTVFYEIYSFALPNGNVAAGDNLDDPDIQEVLQNIPQQMRIWVAGINKSGETNKIQISFSKDSVLLKVYGHDKSWVERGYANVATFITRFT